MNYRRAMLALALTVALAHPPAAIADVSRVDALTKRHARAEGLRFIAPFVDLLDVDRHVGTHMQPPRRCARLSRRTVVCHFSATLADGRVIRSRVRVHLQADGLLGFKTPLDVLRDGVTDEPGSGS